MVGGFTARLSSLHFFDLIIFHLNDIIETVLVLSNIEYASILLKFKKDYFRQHQTVEQSRPSDDAHNHQMIKTKKNCGLVKSAMP